MCYNCSDQIRSWSLLLLPSSSSSLIIITHHHHHHIIIMTIIIMYYAALHLHFPVSLLSPAVKCLLLIHNSFLCITICACFLSVSVCASVLLHWLVESCMWLSVLYFFVYLRCFSRNEIKSIQKGIFFFLPRPESYMSYVIYFSISFFFSSVSTRSWLITGWFGC